MNWMRPRQHLDRDYSFGAHGVFGTNRVFGTEVNNHEEVEREMEGGTMRETRVGEFERGCTVMETVARGIERGAVIDTVAGSIEREMDVVDIEEGSNERTRMYAKVFTHKRKNLGKTYHQNDALMEDKRLKKVSKLVSSPYTTGAKWRRHVDSMRVDPFRDVDPVKKK
ncbi:Hypothetical predicted protein [Olea europaea subsp. europaea]|uniref:Uncharacterized protein n=1 Tax=Olea europaea subsp. europaea TaxID=158383 RepID=A0A8S0UAI1_OLEEU|nr:Hypothetical predicted protein [Olea europaea subsp. europaea]